MRTNSCHRLDEPIAIRLNSPEVSNVRSVEQSFRGSSSVADDDSPRQLGACGRETDGRPPPRLQGLAPRDRPEGHRRRRRRHQQVAAGAYGLLSGFLDKQSGRVREALTQNLVAFD